MNIFKNFSLLISVSLSSCNLMSSYLPIADCKDALKTVGLVTAATVGYSVLHDTVSRHYLRKWQKEYDTTENTNFIVARSLPHSCKAGIKYGLMAGFLTAFVTHAGNFHYLPSRFLPPALLRLSLYTGIGAITHAGIRAYGADSYSSKIKSCQIADSTALKISSLIGGATLALIAHKRVSLAPALKM